MKIKKIFICNKKEMVEDNELNKFIDKLHLRSFDKIWIHVKNEFNEGGVNEK